MCGERARLVRRAFAFVAMKRRIAHDMGVVALHVRWQVQCVDGHEYDAIAHLICRRVLIRNADQIALDFSAGDRDVRYASREAQTCGPGTTTKLKHAVALSRRNRRGEHDGVETGTKSA